MDRTIARLNVERFRRLLAAETDGVQRQTLVRLLAEEEEKLAALDGYYLDEILAMAIAELGADMGNIQLLDRRHQTLSIAAQRGFGQDFLDHFREVSAGDNCACGRALREQKRIIIEDVETDGSFASMRPIARAAGFRAVQSTPLIGRHNQPLGMLSTHFSSKYCPSALDFRRLGLHVDRIVGLICWRTANTPSAD